MNRILAVDNRASRLIKTSISGQDVVSIASISASSKPSTTIKISFLIF